jgi:ubiquinone biosynthesis protein
VGRELDPEFNMSDHLAPFVEEMLRQRYSPRQVANRLLAESKVFLELVHDVPLQLGRTLDKLSRDELKIQLEHRGFDHLVTELDRSSNRVVISLVMSSLIIASALVIRAVPGWMWFSGGIFVFTSLLGVWLIYGVFRSGRL